MAKVSFEQFVREKLALIDDNHTKLFLKKIQLEKDLENTKEQILMLEGAHQYTDQFLAEFELMTKKSEELKAESLEKKPIESKPKVPRTKNKPEEK